VLGALEGRRRVASRLVHSAVEHSAIVHAARRHGGPVTIVGVDRLGRADVTGYADAE
jgi:cysteine desulfurase